MQISVWDTYVKREDGKIMHFDVIVPSKLKDPETIFEYGNQYLKSKTFKTGVLTATECTYCHAEQASEDVIQRIEADGYYILEMENCS